MRNMPALSAEECAVLRTKHVCVVGCGGLGGYIIELLARVGVGSITVVDADVFDVTNLNRQLLSDETVIGQSKAETAANRIAKVNSSVRVTFEKQLFTSHNSKTLLSDCDLAIDALDNIPSRKALAHACAIKGIYMIHGAISSWFGQISIVPPGSGIMDRIYPTRIKNLPANGNLGFVATACASVQTSEAVKLLCGRESALVNRVLLLDMESLDFTLVDI